MVATGRIPEDLESAANRQTASLAALAVLLALVVGGLYLVQTLRQTTEAGDCLLSGRTNCGIRIAVN
jgi:hypothetical protein